MPELKRVLFEISETWVADLDVEEAGMVLDPHADLLDLSDVFERLKRIAHGRGAGVCDASLTVDTASDHSWLNDFAINGTDPEGWYWTARQYVMRARTTLSAGRYREGDCKEMDAVNAALGVVEEQLRVLAMAVDESRKVAS